MLRSGAPARTSAIASLNAARVLKAFSRTDRELGVSQLARRLGLGVSTVHRLVATLADEGLLESLYSLHGDGEAVRPAVSDAHERAPKPPAKRAARSFA